MYLGPKPSAVDHWATALYRSRYFFIVSACGEFRNLDLRITVRCSRHLSYASSYLNLKSPELLCVRIPGISIILVYALSTVIISLRLLVAYGIFSHDNCWWAAVLAGSPADYFDYVCRTNSYFFYLSETLLRRFHYLSQRLYV